MKVTQEKLEGSQAVLNIGVEPVEMEEYLTEAYHHLVKRVQIPGFRRGKTPRPVLERFIGKEALVAEALEHLVPRVYEQALKEQGLEAIAQPQIEILQKEPAVIRATIPLRPTVKLGDYRQIRLTPESVTITEEQISEVQEELRRQQAPWEPVERPVSQGDLVTMDVLGKEGEKTVLEDKEVQYQVAADSPAPVPGFSSKLEGMAKGEEKEFSIPFPAEHPSPNLAGKEYLFKVAVKEVKERKLPELNDDFAKGLGQGLDNLAQLRERIESNLKTRAGEAARRRFEESVLEAVAECSKAEYPAVLVEQEIERLLSQQAQAFQGGEKGLEAYLKNIGKTAQELQEELRPIAIKRIVQSVVLEEVEKQEAISASPEEVEAEVEKMSSGAGDKAGEIRQLFSTPQARGSLEQIITRRKTLQRLADIAEGKVAEPQAQAEATPGTEKQEPQ